MQCNEDERAHVNHEIQPAFWYISILFFRTYWKVPSFHNHIASAPVDEDSLEALGLLSDHVLPHHHQPIQTQYYYIALLERSPLVPHTYYGGRHHQSNKICEDEKGRPRRRLESNSKIVDSHLWTGLVQLSLLFYYMKKYFLVWRKGSIGPHSGELEKILIRKLRRVQIFSDQTQTRYPTDWGSQSLLLLVFLPPFMRERWRLDRLYWLLEYWWLFQFCLRDNRNLLWKYHPRK